MNMLKLREPLRRRNGLKAGQSRGGACTHVQDLPPNSQAGSLAAELTGASSSEEPCGWSPPLWVGPSALLSTLE